MEIPYTDLELRSALLGLDADKFDKTKLDEINDELSKLCPAEKKDLNMVIAKYHGISAEQLINSPNYEVLCKEYRENVIGQLVEKLKEKLGFTDKQAWAVVALMKGLIS